MNKLILILASVLLVLVLFFIPFRTLVFSEQYYKNELKSLNVYDSLGKDKTNFQIKQVISYLRRGEANLSAFNEREQLHFVDVKRIIDMFSIIAAISLIILAFIFHIYWNSKSFPTILISGGIASISATVLLFLASLLDFNSLFIRFHSLLFTPGTWQFNPETEIMKQLFPDQFFSDFLTTSLVWTVVLSIALILIGVVYKKAFKQQIRGKRK
jgi:integral membrane protein (TIGR01906 family)